MFEVTCGLGASPGASSTRPSGSCPRWWPTPDSTGTAGTRSPTRSAPAPRRPTCGSTRRNACHARGRIPNPQITRSTLVCSTRLASNDASRQCHESTRSTGLSGIAVHASVHAASLFLGVAVTLRESRDYLPRTVTVEQDAVLGVPGDRAGVRAVLYRRALAVILQPLRHTGARDETVRLIRRNILQQVPVEALG